MAVTIYHKLVKLSPPTWQHDRPMIASTIVLIIQWQMIMIAWVIQYGKANPRLDASLLQCILRSASTYRHLSLPQSSSSSRFTAGASAFFILSQSGERPER